MHRRSDHTKDVVPLQPKPTIVGAQDVPAFLLASNPFIRTGYRANTATLRATTQSLCLLHNETVNIWSHLIAFWAFVVWAVYLLGFSARLDEASASDKLVIGCYFVGVSVLMGASTAMHWFSCRSEAAYGLLTKLDHGGIIGLLAASDIPPVYFGFACYPSERAAYLTLLPCVCAVALAALLHPTMQKDTNRRYRIACLAAVAVFGWIQMGHEIYLKGGFAADGERVLSGWAAAFSFYTIGAVFYASYVPERCSPRGAFDIWGSSHQIWHLFVIGGAAYHVKNVLEYWEHSSCPNETVLPNA